MTKLITKKIQEFKNEHFLRLISSSTAGKFADYKNMMSNQIPNFTIPNDTIFTELSNKISSFRKLLTNWDSYNANPITLNAINTALGIANHLNNKRIFPIGIEVNVFPMRDGGIQFEFDGENIIAELEISPKGELTFIHFDEEGNIIGHPENIYELSEISILLGDAQYA